MLLDDSYLGLIKKRATKNYVITISENTFYHSRITIQNLAVL